MSTEGTVPPNASTSAPGSGLGDPSQASKIKEAMAEKQWDYERVKNCVEFLQMGVEKLLLLLPEGIIRDMVTSAAAMVASYRRRYQFIVAKVSLSSTLPLLYLSSTSPLPLLYLSLSAVHLH
jgi:hypothetical protein